ncbi:hypothetical protein J2S43_008379 [Catenuloplanes nepalensis]|uniref:Sortase n=1 Tax=Catenuloplanes nepalensis TaxID=587533 RepID=A0ABT9N827_9ACTN|nr:hypothetical protein [Catenuloplanes nepalensis]MDP9799867.1 hypothetical protein [Catenuloplanes nepalensis]
MRSLLRLAVLPALAAAVLSTPSAAQARADVFVEVNPSTIAAGREVAIRASCEENVVDALVRSDAFGEVRVSPEYGFLTGEAEIPAGTNPDDYQVELVCTGGGRAIGTLRVVADTRPSQGPATGFGGMAGAGPDAGGLALLGGGLAAMVAGAALIVLRLRRRRSG